MSVVASSAIVAAVRRFWWVLPLAALFAWAMILRAEKASLGSDLLAERNAHKASIASWDAAVKTAQLLDLENKRFVEERQAEESERIAHDYEARIADARARAAVSLRTQAAAADQGGRGGAPVSGVPDPARRVGEATCEAGLPAALDAADALIATEQAIQLDALIDWVGAQSRISINEKDEAHD
ncbi:hypothetical protein ACIPPQ_14650 [Sphingopyxis sp. LARHCG72]